MSFTKMSKHISKTRHLFAAMFVESMTHFVTSPFSRSFQKTAAPLSQVNTSEQNLFAVTNKATTGDTILF